MRYLLDTCVLSDFVRGDSNTVKKVKSLSPNELCLSTITVMEIRYGILCLHNSKKALAIKAITDEIIDNVIICDFTDSTARIAANIRTLLNDIGEPIGAYDILTAATAIDSELILVTSNTREFSKIKDLCLENWRD